MEYHFLFALMLLLVALCDSEQQGLVITNPPQDNVVCVGDKVNITCGFNFSYQITTVWIIGGRPFSGSDIENSTIFESPMVADNQDTVLLVYPADESLNQTSFQCEFTFHPPVQSSVGILTVMGPPTRPVIKVLERRLTSLVISWDTFSHTSCGDVTYNVTLSDGTAELVEERTTTSNTISFTDLDNDTEYEVTVLAINNAGPATVVTANVTTLTPSIPSPPRDLEVVIKFVDYKPVVKITWNVSQLSPNMTELERFTVFLNDEADWQAMYEVGPDETTFSSDDDVSTHLNIGTYTISVCSVNSVGHSETVSAPLAVKWLQSVSVKLHPENTGINVSCSVTESTPLVKCVARLNCSESNEVVTKVFTDNTFLPVKAGSDYQLSVQVIRADNGLVLEDYSNMETISIPKSTTDNNPSSRTPTASSSSSDNNSAIYIAALGAVVLLLIVLLATVLCYLCIFRKSRRSKLVSLESNSETKIVHSNESKHSDLSLCTSTSGSIKDHNQIPPYCEVADLKTPKRKSTSSNSTEVPSYSEVVELKTPKARSCCLEGEKSSPITRCSSESAKSQKQLKPEQYAVVDMNKKHSKSNYVELAGFDDKKLTVMPVPVPEVTYSNVKDLSMQESSS